MSDKKKLSEEELKPKTADAPKIPPIEEAKGTVSEFLKRALSVKDAKVVRLGKAEEGWEAEVEVYEESSFIKSLGLPTRVQDRNIYTVKLNDDLEVQSYERKGRLGINE